MLCLILIIHEGGLCIAFLHRMRLAVYFSNRILFFFAIVPLCSRFHRRNFDTFYMNANLKDISNILQ